MAAKDLQKNRKKNSKKDPGNSRATEIAGFSTNSIKRYPRPYGLTLTSLNAQKTRRSISNKKDPAYQNTKIKTIEYCIDCIIRDNMEWSGNLIPITKIAQLLRIDPTNTQEILNKRLENRGKLTESGTLLEAYARVLTEGSIFGSLELRARIKAQTELLQQSQGGRYQAFISTTVNQSMANEINANKSLMELIKLIADKIPTALKTPDGNKTGPAQWLTPDAAIQLLSEQGISLLHQPEELKKLEVRLLQEGVPEVNAVHQNLTNIGIRHDGTKVAQSAEKATQTIHLIPAEEGKKKRKNHQTRREMELELIDETVPE